MINLFVARIHNNRLGTCLAVSSYDEGIKLIEKYVRDQYQRDLNQEEKETLEDTYEFYNDSDPDNIVSFTIGAVE